LENNILVNQKVPKSKDFKEKVQLFQANDHKLWNKFGYFWGLFHFRCSS